MTYTEKLILGICNRLQLQPSLYDSAEKRYKTITKIIQEDSVFDRIPLRIYPQGSFRLKTTVKPLKGNEYDLDFVAELPKNSSMTPRQLYNHIYRILATDGIHENMLEKKSRCIRVVYANDFHMDIMPGQEVDRDTNEIIVPDRELARWYHHSNPIGYAEWFEEQAKTQIRYELFEKHQMAGKTEPLDDQEVTLRLEPLRRAVQLVKRYRDIYCDKNEKEPVRSIVICTLMGYISSSYSNEVEIIDDFCRYVNGKINAAGEEPFEVRNPVVDEVLTEKWEENPKNYEDFVQMMRSLTRDIQKLKLAKTNIDIVLQLKVMFGESVTNEVVKESADLTGKARKAGTLAVGATGILNTSKVGATVKPNNFYGG